MSEPQAHEGTWLDLYDYRQRVARLYNARDAALRAGQDAASTAARFRADKDALYARHPQSPLAVAERAAFAGLRYFAYAPAWAVVAELEPAPSSGVDPLPASGALPARFVRAGRLRFAWDGQPLHLEVYWIDVYGGGLFCPFRDTTSSAETYGGGRYLFDTVKGSQVLHLADATDAKPEDLLGYRGGRVLLDFNYAYNPSCAYDARWVCPLAPHENRLPLSVRAGEQSYHA